jgi:hypothetical protein
MHGRAEKIHKTATRKPERKRPGDLGLDGG